jgi:hypothetical protein
MIEGQEVTERTHLPTSVESQPTRAVLAQACMGVFLYVQCLIQFLQCFFCRNPLRTAAYHLVSHYGTPVVRGPQFEKHWSTLTVFAPLTHTVLRWCKRPASTEQP